MWEVKTRTGNDTYLFPVDMKWAVGCGWFLVSNHVFTFLCVLFPFLCVCSDLPPHIHPCFPFFVVCVFFRHFRKMSSVFFVLIPELFFMVCLFGYLVFMVVFKWIAYTPAQSKIAPSILIHFIDMFLFSDNPDNPQLYKGQVCVVCSFPLKEYNLLVHYVPTNHF